MPALRGSTLARTRSAIAVAVRKGDAQAEADARRAHVAARLEEDIREAVDAWPPLTAEQRDRLAAILRPAADRLRAGGRRG